MHLLLTVTSYEETQYIIIPATHMRSCKIAVHSVQFTYTVLGDTAADLAKTCFSYPAQTLFEYHSIPDQ